MLHLRHNHWCRAPFSGLLQPMKLLFQASNRCLYCSAQLHCGSQVLALDARLRSVYTVDGCWRRRTSLTTVAVFALARESSQRIITHRTLTTQSAIHTSDQAPFFKCRGHRLRQNRQPTQVQYCTAQYRPQQEGTQANRSPLLLDRDTGVTRTVDGKPELRLVVRAAADRLPPY